MDIPCELVEQLRKGNIVLFCGAGISISEGGVPSGSQLACELAQHAGLGDIGSMSLPEVAQACELELGRPSLIAYVTKRVNDSRYSPLRTHQLIATLPFKRIITTNWDILLEEALRQAHKSCCMVARDSTLPYGDDEEVLLIKLHGSADQADTVIITDDDYYDVFAHLPQVANLVQSFFAANTILFLGYSLADADFKRLYFEVVHHLGKHKRRAYAIQLNPTPLEVKYWNRKDVQVIAADGTIFLECLVSELSQYYLDNPLQPYIAHVDFVCGNLATASDSQQIDNLEIALKWLQTMNRGNEYLKLADGFSSLLYLIGHVNRAIEVADAGRKMAQRLQDQKKEYDFLNKLILYFTWSDQFDEANTVLEEALDLAKHLSGYRLDNVLEYQGSYLMRRDGGARLFDAYEPLAQSTDLRESLNTPMEDSRVTVLGRYMMGVWCYRAAIRLRTKHSSEPEVSALSRKLGISSALPHEGIARELLVRAEEWLKKGLELADTLDFERGRSYILNYLGKVYMAQGDWKEARQKLTDALQLANALVDKRRVARTQASLFELCRDEGNLDEAKHWAYIAIEGFTSLGMTQDAKEITDQLGNTIR